MTPDKPHRIEARVEVEASPEQVWRAIATGPGIGSWFLPTDLDERVGGEIVFHMGESSSRGEVTHYEAPRRLVYQEPRWAELAGEDAGTVTPLVTEFIVEAQSGGSCTVRVVTSAYGTGADWENEFFEQMRDGWDPLLENLEIYLRDFADVPVTHLEVESIVEMAAPAAWDALRHTLGARSVGDRFELHGLEGTVHRITRPELLIRLTGIIPGHLMAGWHDMGDGRTLLRAVAYLFSEDAADYVATHRTLWTTTIDPSAGAG